MEKYGLSFEELEVQGAELLPDRLELKRGKRNKVRCNNANINFLVFDEDAFANGNQICLLQS